MFGVSTLTPTRQEAGLTNPAVHEPGPWMMYRRGLTHADLQMSGAYILRTVGCIGMQTATQIKSRLLVQLRFSFLFRRASGSKK